MQRELLLFFVTMSHIVSLRLCEEIYLIGNYCFSESIRSWCIWCARFKLFIICTAEKCKLFVNVFISIICFQSIACSEFDNPVVKQYCECMSGIIFGGRVKYNIVSECVYNNIYVRVSIRRR